MLTGKPAVRIGLNPMPGGSHWPHGIISGWSWFSAKHATVLIRRESYDANWGYYTQDASKLVDGKKKCLGVLSWKFSGNFDRCIFNGRFGFLGSPKVKCCLGVSEKSPTQSTNLSTIWWLAFCAGILSLPFGGFYGFCCCISSIEGNPVRLWFDIVHISIRYDIYI